MKITSSLSLDGGPYMKLLPKQNITLKTIAKLAQVSPTTVSRALNNSSNIKPETKAKIIALAKKLG